MRDFPKRLADFPDLARVKPDLSVLNINIQTCIIFVLIEKCDKTMFILIVITIHISIKTYVFVLHNNSFPYNLVSRFVLENFYL